jgi:hypothetical protein
VSKQRLPRHMKQLRLRADFRGPLLPVPELERWERRMKGKYEWCTRCRVARLKAAHKAHLEVMHRKEAA